MEALTYRPYHISHVVRDKTLVGQIEDGIYLHKIIVNTGGHFVLSLYNGQREMEPIAVFHELISGTCFQYDCFLEQGLAFTFTQYAPSDICSVTVIYAKQEEVVFETEWGNDNASELEDASE